MGGLGAFGKDIKSVLSQLKYEEEHLRVKRRWLMGIAELKSDPQQLQRPKFLEYKALPESLLREDDTFYETTKDFVQKACGACDLDNMPAFSFDNRQLFDAFSIEKNLLSGLDDMTSKGLFLLAMILTGGSASFEKSRSKMKKTIREFLPKVLRKHANCGKVNILEILSQHLCNPHNFRRKHGVFMNFVSMYHRIAASKILDELEDMPYETLQAMHRKLRCLHLDAENLTSQKSGWNKKVLIKQVRGTCQKMLSRLGEGDSLQEPLAKAMAVAGLSLKLTRGSQELNLTEFYQFSPEIITLQDEIIRAILILNTKVRIDELKYDWKPLLDPNDEIFVPKEKDVNISCRSLRTKIRKMLVNFLFECSDMRVVPEYLLNALVKLNKSSESVPRKCLPQEEIEEEVECILGVSAQAKQVVWDMLPGHDFERDFYDAYLEDPETSSSNNSSGISSEIDSIGESVSPDYSDTATSTCKKNDHYSSPPLDARIKLDSAEISEDGNVAEMNSVNCNDPVSSQFKNTSVADASNLNMDECKKESRDIVCTPESQSPTHGKYSVLSSYDKSTCKNQYLSIQEACDETSVLAYNLTGQLLHNFVQMEGLDVSLGDSLYLKAEYPYEDECRDANTGKQCLSGESMGDSVLMQLVEERMPFLSKSGKEKLKALMGSSFSTGKAS